MKSLRKALIVGINYYQHVPSLHGCVKDARAVSSLLARHRNGWRNFSVTMLCGTGPGEQVSRSALRDGIQELFAGDEEAALLYFAGHGHIDATGGFLCPSEIKKGADGLALSEVMTFAAKSSARNKIIILDSCHSGAAGDSSLCQNIAELREGMTILTACGDTQYATEENGSGLFTTLLADALSGAASDLMGHITPGSVYAHIDQSLGEWKQRPVFKTNVKRFISLRDVEPAIALHDLQRLTEFFPSAGHEFPLDPEYEPERSPCHAGLPPPHPEKTVVFKILQACNRVNLVIPSGAPHMWHAAMESKACKLTALGQHYRKLITEGLI